MNPVIPVFLSKNLISCLNAMLKTAPRSISDSGCTLHQEDREAAMPPIADGEWRRTDGGGLMAEGREAPEDGSSEIGDREAAWPPITDSGLLIVQKDTTIQT